MVLLQMLSGSAATSCFGTMSFQMVLLPCFFLLSEFGMFWNYVIPDGSTTHDVREQNSSGFWNYVIPDGSTTGWGTQASR